MKLKKELIKKIAVFRALHLGDLLCSIPAIRALRSAYPEAEITLFGLPWAQILPVRFPAYFDRFKHFPGYPGLPEQKISEEAIKIFFDEIKKEHYDLILQMQGNGTIVNSFIPLLGAAYTAGFYTRGDICPDRHLYVSYPAGIPELKRHIRLMEFLGLPAQGDHLEFPLTREDEKDYNNLRLSLIPSTYICMHPGSRGAWRQWPPAYFASLGDHCARKGFPVVLTGTKDERHIVEEVIAQMTQPAINLAGQTGLGAVGWLIKHAYALISNCTGVSHIASAVQTPSVIISMDGEPERWAPLDQSIHHTIDWIKEPDYNKVLLKTQTVLNDKNRRIREQNESQLLTL